MTETEIRGWYYLSENADRLGPVPIEELSALAVQGLVRPETLVWSQGYPDWVPAEKIAELLSAARAVVTPPLVPPALPVAVVAPASSAPDFAQSQHLKPLWGSFVFSRIIGGMFASAVLGAVVSGLLLATEKSPWPGLAVFAAGCGLGVIAGLVAYRKERYAIHHSRVVCHRGGLVSDQTTEFEIHNVTHVKIRLPWLRFKLFGVGDVIVQTAGNSQPVVIRSIRGPEAVYAGIRGRMSQNGYELTQKQLLHEEQPAIIGILGECLGLLLGGLLAGLIVLSQFLESQEKAKSPGLEGFLPVLLGAACLALVVFIIVHFLDFRRRTYRVYNDVVVYEEGFLTRHNAFIPYENIADANTKISLIDRIFGLSDVQVSCQGSGSELKFRRLRNGVALSAAIDHLVVLARQKKQPPPRSGAGAAVPGLRDLPRRTEPAAMPAGVPLVAELRMDAARTIVPLLLLFPIFPLWIVATIQAVVRLKSTRYSVLHGSMRHSYRFLNVYEREFAHDKITGIVIKQNLWDRLFGTMTLRFWSIGSGESLEFAHVKEDQFHLPALLRQAGIPADSSEPYEAKACFGVSGWLRARLAFLPVWLCFAAVAVFAAVRIDGLFYWLLAIPGLAGLIDFLHGRLYYPRQRLRFHDHHIEAEQGIMARRRYYARYSNIKRNRFTRYPGGGQGDLEIFVAGEEALRQVNQQTKGERTNLLKPCSFTTRFLPDVSDQGLLLDDILCGRVEPNSLAVAAEPFEVLLEAPRSAGNAVLKLILFSILLLPLVVLLPLTIPLRVMQVKRWRYRIETARIVVSWGIFYRSSTSILLDRVDSLEKSQGPLNKLFKNGSVRIMTAGTSRPDLDLLDSPAYLSLYELIRDRSR